MDDIATSHEEYEKVFIDTLTNSVSMDQLEEDYQNLVRKGLIKQNKLKKKPSKITSSEEKSPAKSETSKSNRRFQNFKIKKPHIPSPDQYFRKEEKNFSFSPKNTHQFKYGSIEPVFCNGLPPPFWCSNNNTKENLKFWKK